MAVFASDNFNGTPGDRVTTYSANWIPRRGAGDNMVPGGVYDIAILSNTQKVRVNLRYGEINYLNTIPAPSPDYSVSADITLVSQVSGSIAGAGVIGRGTSGTTQASFNGYSLSIDQSGASNAVVRLRKFTDGTPTTLQTTAVFTVTPGSIHTLKLDMAGSTISCYRNGILAFTYVDGSPLTTAGFAGITPNFEATTNAQGYHLDNFVAEYDAAPPPQDLNPPAVYSESYAVKPTLTTTGFLSPAAVYSESYAVKPTLIPVTYPLDVTPVFSRSYAVTPTLSGGPAVLEITPAYSESYAVTPFLATGQVIEPQPVYSEAYAVRPELIPGPVEIEMTPVYSLAYVILPTLAMNLTLNPNAVYSESYARKPTLKSRFPCCGLDSLQDRAGARTAQDGGSLCNIGVRGSDGLVKW